MGGVISQEEGTISAADIYDMPAEDSVAGGGGGGGGGGDVASTATTSVDSPAAVAANAGSMLDVHHSVGMQDDPSATATTAAAAAAADARPAVFAAPSVLDGQPTTPFDCATEKQCVDGMLWCMAETDKQQEALDFLFQFQKLKADKLYRKQHPQHAAAVEEPPVILVNDPGSGNGGDGGGGGDGGITADVFNVSVVPGVTATGQPVGDGMGDASSVNADTAVADADARRTDNGDDNGNGNGNGDGDGDGDARTGVGNDGTTDGAVDNDIAETPPLQPAAPAPAPAAPEFDAEVVDEMYTVISAKLLAVTRQQLDEHFNEVLINNTIPTARDKRLLMQYCKMCILMNDYLVLDETIFSLYLRPYVLETSYKITNAAKSRVMTAKRNAAATAALNKQQQQQQRQAGTEHTLGGSSFTVSVQKADEPDQADGGADGGGGGGGGGDDEYANMSLRAALARLLEVVAQVMDDGVSIVQELYAFEKDFQYSTVGAHRTLVDFTLSKKDHIYHQIAMYFLAQVQNICDVNAADLFELIRTEFGLMELVTKVREETNREHELFASPKVEQRRGGSGGGGGSAASTPGQRLFAFVGGGSRSATPVKQIAPARGGYAVTPQGAATPHGGSGGGGGGGGGGALGALGLGGDDDDFFRPPAPSPVDLSVLDAVLREISLVCNQCEIYVRFVEEKIKVCTQHWRAKEDLVVDMDDERMRSLVSTFMQPIVAARNFEALLRVRTTSQISQCVREILFHYSVLESFFLKRRMEEALARGTNDTDSLFFVVQHCIERSFLSAGCNVVCTVLHESASMLQTKLYGKFAEKFNLFDAPELNARLYAATNIVVQVCQFTLLLYTKVGTMTEARFKSERDRDKIVTTMADLKALHADFEELADRYVGKCFDVVRADVNDVIRTLLQNSYNLTEEAFSANELNEPFVQQFVASLDTIVQSFRPPRLSESAFERFAMHAIAYVADGICNVLTRKTYNMLGGIQLQMDVFSLQEYCATLTRRSVRDKFARLHQVSSVLALEKCYDVLEWGHIRWHFSAAELRQVMACRVDWRQTDALEHLDLNAIVHNNDRNSQSTTGGAAGNAGRNSRVGSTGGGRAGRGAGGGGGRRGRRSSSNSGGGNSSMFAGAAAGSTVLM